MKGGEMLILLSNRKKAILTGLQIVSRFFGKHPKIVVALKTFLKIFSIGFIIFAYTMVTTSSSYRVTEGQLTYRMNPSWHGGFVELPLGPAGMVSFKTHKTPVNLRMDLVLNKDLMNGQSLGDAWDSGVSKFKPNAISALYDFLFWRFFWLVLIGAAVGIEVTNGGKRWLMRLVRNIGIWAGVFALFAIAFAGITSKTLDRTPEVKYTGPIAEFPKVVSLIKKIGSDYKVGKNVLQNFIDGMTYVTYQIDNQPYADTSDPRTRVLVISDVHDNLLGIKIVSDLLEGKAPERFDAAILTGDITNFGTKVEARAFAGQITSQIPIYMVGGNHEDSEAMTTFQRMGYKILEGVPISIGSLSILGYSDPLASSYLIDSDEQMLKVFSGDMASWWDNYTSKPQVVVVHDIRQAEGIIEKAKAERVALTVVFGHDHQTSITQEGTVNLIGSGTGGASGFDEIGRNPDSPYSFQILDFSQGTNPKLLMVTTLSYDVESGKLTAIYTPIN